MKIKAETYNWSSSGSVVSVGLHACENCNAPQIGLTPATSGITASNALSRATDLAWLPQSAVGKDFPEVPGHIASTADEAHRCFSIQAFRACCAMSRAALEGAAVDRGHTKGNLYEKIESMQKAGLLRANIAEAAHKLRAIGNAVLHADSTDPVSKQDADDALWLLDEVLSEAYQSTSRLDAIQARFAAKDS